MTDKKYIIREYEPEYSDFSFYFDGDCFNGSGEDYKHNLFIVMNGRNGATFNEEEYNRVCNLAEELQDCFNDIEGRGYYYYNTFKEIMNDYARDHKELSYNPSKCHKLRKVLRRFDRSDRESVCAFLEIYTGIKWGVISAYGYCQGDYAEVIYCEEAYTEQEAKAAGEIWLGAAKEFCVIELDESGEETDCVCGFFVADCQAWHDEDYKKLVSEWYGINEEEAQLEMIDGWKTYTKYNYRIA